MPSTDKNAGAGDSSISFEDTSHHSMKKPTIHTTAFGTQYVKIIDIIESEAGWAEIERLRDANLVPNAPANETGAESASPTNEHELS